MVAIIQHNAGNIASVQNALHRLQCDNIVTNDIEKIRRADKVILPGVGEASAAMNYLRERNLDKLIQTLQQPVLGICLGQQLLCEHSEESNTTCLGIFKASVKLFPPSEIVPHVGWNTIYDYSTALFIDVPEQSDVYFIHSYYTPINEYTIASSKYIIPFSAAMSFNNFYATQFHPEKSASVGEQILSNFIRLT